MEDAGLCEHVSRESRAALVSLLIEALGSPTRLAAELGITEMAVRKWILRLTHPSNINLQKIIELAFGTDARQTGDILEEGFLKHRVELGAIRECAARA
jgi:transposase-like protein